MAKRVLVITGSKRLTRMLNALGSKQARAFHRKAIRTAAKVVLAEAKRRSPVRTGKLRSSLTVKALKRSRKGIGVQVTQKEGAFKGEAFYGSFVEFGYRRGKRRKEYRRKGGLQDTRKKIPGQWTMRAAGIAKEDEAIEIYEKEVERLIKTEANK